MVLIEDRAASTQVIQELVAEGLHAVTRYAKAAHDAGFSNRVNLPRPKRLPASRQGGRDIIRCLEEWIAEGLIDTISGGAGKGGTVSVMVAGQPAIDGAGNSPVLTGIAAGANAGSTGNAGNVTVPPGICRSSTAARFRPTRSEPGPPAR